MYRKSLSISGKPRLNQTGKKQVGLDVFLLSKGSEKGSLIKVKIWLIEYEFKKEIDYKEHNWFIFEIFFNHFFSKGDLWKFLMFDTKNSLVPKTLKAKPKKIRVSVQHYKFHMLKRGVSLKISFGNDIFDVNLKLEFFESRQIIVFKIDVFRSLIFKLKNERNLNKEVCEKIYRTFLSNYIQFLKDL